MSSLAGRLREVIGPIGRAGAGVSSGAVSAGGGATEQDPAADPAALLGGQWRETRGQRFVVIDQKYSPGYRHGRVAVADSLPPADGMWPFLPLLAGTACRGRLLFVDLETTGLVGGAGSYAFLVGCAWFDSAVFRVRQFFLSSFAGERALLEAVAETADSAGTLVTFNGKSFDMPLMETRFALHRMETPFAALPHLDMVHSARRLWRSDADRQPAAVWGSPTVAARSTDCRLSTLEDVLCGYTREGDVPGFEIPSRYFHYVRSGNVRVLEQVLEHNRLDLLALALVTARASQLLEDGPGAARTAGEALGMGRVYERAGLAAEARAAFDRAAQMPADPVTRAEALRAYAVLSRRERCYEAAAGAWRRILDLRGCPVAICREATEALAVHHEHRLRDPHVARSFALQSASLPQTPARRDAVQHRLARLNRKLESAPGGRLSLF